VKQRKQYREEAKRELMDLPSAATPPLNAAKDDADLQLSSSPMTDSPTDSKRYSRMIQLLEKLQAYDALHRPMPSPAKTVANARAGQGLLHHLGKKLDEGVLQPSLQHRFPAAPPPDDIPRAILVAAFDQAKDKSRKGMACLRRLGEPHRPASW